MKHIIALLFRSETALPTAPRAMLAALLLTMACGLGGCASGGANNGSYAMAGGGTGGTTVTFESIDGPPPQVFDRMVNVLDSESKLRNLSIVSREGAAAYPRCGFPARNRPARPDATLGRRPTIFCCGKSPRPG